MLNRNPQPLLFFILLGTLAFTAREKDRLQEDAADHSNTPADSVLTGQGASGNWTSDAPGMRHHVTSADLPKPFATASVDNGPHLVSRPAQAWPHVKAGFKVDLFLTGLDNPRLIRTAPNGDIFVAESSPGRIRVLRAADGADHPEINEVFVSGLEKPFGIAFYPPRPKSSVRLYLQHGGCHPIPLSVR
ncbi:MAG TPA: hypothetical protein VL126_08200 [Bacteroidota bacterium]|nr:hypothetical protein [Bacteroidota bacterium]